MDSYKTIDNYKIVDVDRIDRTPRRMHDNTRIIIKETEILQYLKNELIEWLDIYGCISIINAIKKCKSEEEIIIIYRMNEGFDNITPVSTIQWVIDDVEAYEHVEPNY
mmetsp:Transcript_10791/g.14070  ORF Transcript_10791/g.14070 Transcript_10791/m.14070 type:complete len:108 (+) Transcript_10791:308-631(+)